MEPLKDNIISSQSSKMFLMEQYLIHKEVLMLIQDNFDVIFTTVAFLQNDIEIHLDENLTS